MDTDIASWLRAVVREPARWATEDLAGTLRAVIDAAHAAWPGIALDDRVFVEHLAKHADNPQALGTLRTSDLYLACACARGERAAIEAFEASYFQEIDLAARRANAGDTFAHEAKQRLRHLLFVGDEAHPPAVAGFGGRGDLRGWLRVAATRDLIHSLQRAKREVSVDDTQLFDMLSPVDDPELAYITELYREQATAAVRVAFEGLDARERRLLRMSIIEGLSIDDLGAIHGVHRTTARRWLQAARDGILERTRRELASRLGAATPEVDSILKLFHHRIDISLERVLATPE